MGTLTERDLHLGISDRLQAKLRWIANREETSVSNIVRQVLQRFVRDQVPEGAALPPLPKKVAKRSK